MLFYRLINILNIGFCLLVSVCGSVYFESFELNYFVEMNKITQVVIIIELYLSIACSIIILISTNIGVLIVCACVVVCTLYCKRNCKRSVRPIRTPRKLRSSDEDLPSSSTHDSMTLQGEINEEQYEQLQMQRIEGRRPLRTPIRGVIPRKALTTPTDPPTMTVPKFKDAPKRSSVRRAASAPPQFGSWGSSWFRNRKSVNTNSMATLVLDESSEEDLTVFSNVRLATAEERSLGYDNKYITTGKDAKDWLARSREHERDSNV
jgi:hypothetical protein